MLSESHQPALRNRRRPKSLLLAAGLAGLAVTAAACSSGKSAAPAEHNANPPASVAKPSVISTRSTPLGTILTTSSGRSVYLFENDKGNTSTCTSACASLWPPVTTTRSPVVTGIANGNLLGTTHRSDGTLQVTYAGHPLYLFAGDHAAGDTTGQGLKDFGAGWYVVAANGNKIDAG